MRHILRRLARRRATPSHLALFAALGDAYAAVTVTGKNIKDGTVTGETSRTARSARAS